MIVTRYVSSFALTRSARPRPPVGEGWREHQARLASRTLGARIADRVSEARWHLRALRAGGGVGACYHCGERNPLRSRAWDGRWQCHECHALTGPVLLRCTGLSQ